MSALAVIDNTPPCAIHYLGAVDYEATWRRMQAFTTARNDSTPDEIWLLEHPPTYTAGLNARSEHFPSPSDIPLVRCDRGGQISYHGPGQLVAYCLIDIRRLKIGVRVLVDAMEQALIDLLADYNVIGTRVVGAPGVYVEQKKIAALGLRIRNGCSYHGLSLNVAMDLAPFRQIDPCGYRGLDVTQTSELGISAGCMELAPLLAAHLTRQIYARAR